MATSLYQRIADELRDAIRDGSYPAGSQLPTEEQLQDRYQASRNTVRAAVAELRAQGLVVSRPRLGTVVRDQAVLEHRAATVEKPGREGRSDSWSAQVEAAGRAPSQDFELRLEPAGERLARRLHVAVDDLVVVRDLMRYVDGTPWSTQTSYYPRDVADQAGLAVPHDIAQGTVRAMAAAGLVEVGHIDEVTARMPTPEESRQFELPAGVPLMIFLRVAHTADRVVRVTRELHPADRHVLVYELGEPLPA